MNEGLRLASARGVDIKVVLAAESDARSSKEQLTFYIIIS